MILELYYNGKNLENPGLKEIEDALREIKVSGQFCLSYFPEPHAGPYLLEVQSEGGNYMPSMGVIRGKDRVFVNEAGRGKEDVPMLGYDVMAMMVTQDFSLIERIVREFYETGDVSRELLK